MGIGGFEKRNINKEADENASTSDEKLLILPLNDQNSKMISQIISNDTARNILETIASKPLSASEIAEKLGIPLSTVQYNLGKLNDAGLVKAERMKYSEKMKPVKIYAPHRKFVVITTGKTSKEEVIVALKRYLALISIAAVGSGIIEFLAMRMRSSLEEVARSIPTEGLPTPIPAPVPMPAPAVTPSPIPAPKGIGLGFGFDVFAHPGLWFLFGCLCVILAIFLIEYLGHKKGREEKS